MEKYILRFKGSGKAPERDMCLIKGNNELKIIDTTLKMVLVETCPSVINSLSLKLDEWSISEEKKIPLPDTRIIIK